jgi:hypothetical protein
MIGLQDTLAIVHESLRTGVVRDSTKREDWKERALASREEHSRNPAVISGVPVVFYLSAGGAASG